MRDQLTVERLKEVLDYDPETGVFTWKKRPASTRMEKVWNGNFAGKVAGSINFWGYVIIPITFHGRKKAYPAHRLAWFYMTGEWPVADVDHRNRDRADNKWKNLRAATRGQNLANMCSRRDGLKGVSQNRRSGNWRAEIQIDKKRRCLGTFPTEIEAHAAYADAARLAYGEFARAA